MMGRILIGVVVLLALGAAIGFTHSRVKPIGKFRFEPEPAPVTTPAGAEAPADPPAADPGVKQDEPAPAPAAPDTPTPAVAPAQPDHFISLARARELFDKGRSTGTVYFIDARPLKDFVAGHVAGAMHVPPEALKGRPPQKVLDFLPGNTVVVYCHGELCTDSEAVAIRLQDLKRDIKPIYIMKDGFDPWKAAGHPVETGADSFGN